MDPMNESSERPEPVSEQAAHSLEATEAMWRSVHAEFGLFTAQELTQLLGLRVPDDVRRLYEEGGLIAIHRGSRVLYPGFQVERDAHAVLPVIRDLRLAAESAGRSESSLILWLLIPTGYLDGARPVDRLAEPQRVLAAASDSFNVEW